jgi:predicted site-specific integrase-resolvase
MEPLKPEPLLTSGEVADLFRVDPRTVVRWGREGKIPTGAVVMTPGGQRRYREAWVRSALNGTEDHTWGKS